MTKTEALYQFFSSFGIDAYPSGSVPDKVAFPWLTYEPVTSNYWGQRTVESTVNLWYHTDSESVPNAKADEIAKKIGGGYPLKCDDGIIYIFNDSGWFPLNDENDSSIKRRYTNLTFVFETN